MTFQQGYVTGSPIGLLWEVGMRQFALDVLTALAVFVLIMSVGMTIFDWSV